MRHRRSGRRLGRTTAHRKALMSNMCKALIEYERIETTDAKAKELRRAFERLITLGKQQSVHARRIAFSRLRSRESVNKLFNEIAPRYQERPGGYTRIVKVGRRKGDNTPVSIIELVATASVD